MKKTFDDEKKESALIPKVAENGSCECLEKDIQKSKLSEDDVEAQMTFENYLQNMIFMKR